MVRNLTQVRIVLSSSHINYQNSRIIVHTLLPYHDTSLSASHYSKSEGVISKAQRRSTVGYLPNVSDTPLIKLSSKWLSEAGFNSYTSVTVRVAGDCIVLIPDSPQEQTLREQLVQVKNTLVGLNRM